MSPLYIFLSLHPTRAVAAHEFCYVGNGNTVEIADDAVLEAACRDCEFQCGLLAFVMVQAIEQAARNAVAAADAVDDVPNFVPLGNEKVLAVVQARRPAIPVGAVALAERDGDALHVWVWKCQEMCSRETPKI